MDQQTKSIWTRKTLDHAKTSTVFEKFARPLDTTSYWNDDDPEFEDCLYICTQGCQAAMCDCMYPHCTVDPDHWCLAYDPVPLDSMIGESYHHEKAPDKIKFRQYWKETSEVACQNPLSKADGVAQGQDEI
jgi:hypothetical protein